MQLRDIYNHISGEKAPEGFAMLAFPDNDLEQIKVILKDYLVRPDMLSEDILEYAVNQVAEMASSYFDKALEPEAKAKKNRMRRNLLMKSAKSNDGTLLFFLHNEIVYGYNRVLPITEEQWQSYLEEYNPSESGFDICKDLSLLEEGKARIYFQAIVLPELPQLCGKDKYVLQTVARMHQLAGFLKHIRIEKAVRNTGGIKLNLTSFHLHTDRWASGLNAKKIGENPKKCTIYEFDISPNSPRNSFGYALYQRLESGKKPLQLD